MRFHFNTEAVVKRLGTYSGNKSTYAQVATGVRGFFVPMSPQQSVAVLGLIGQGFQFTTDGAKDIKVSDILTIGGSDYGVMGIARYRMASQDFLQVTLQIQING